MYLLAQTSKNEYSISIRGKIYGYLYREVGGYFVFTFAKPEVNGCLPEHFFTYISETLKELNTC